MFNAHGHMNHRIELDHRLVTCIWNKLDSGRNEERLPTSPAQDSIKLNLSQEQKLLREETFYLLS